MKAVKRASGTLGECRWNVQVDRAFTHEKLGPMFFSKFRDLKLDVWDKERAIVFAGFNVLNDVEQAMMSLVQREGKARFYWDYDVYYCDPDKDNEAGYFMKQNLRNFPNAISEEEAFDNFSHLSDVTFIACTSDNAAARYVNTYVNEELRMKNEEFPIGQETSQRNTASTANSSIFSLHSSLSVVLCNEALM